MYVFGGQNGKQCFSDFYEINLESYQCKKQNLNNLPAIHSHQIIPISNSELIIIGGMKANGSLEQNDYIISKKNNIFTSNQLRTNQMHCPIYAHTVNKIGNVLYLIGGLTQGNSFNAYIYQFEIQRLKWDICSLHNVAPINRYYHNATTIGEKILISGGRIGENNNQLIDSVWLFTPQYKQFQRVETKGKFIARAAFSQIQWKSTTGNIRIVVIGGESAQGTIFDGIQMLMSISGIGNEPGLIKSRVSPSNINEEYKIAATPIIKEENIQEQKVNQSTVQFNDNPEDMQLSTVQTQNQYLPQQVQQYSQAVQQSQSSQQLNSSTIKKVDFLEFEIVKIMEQNKNILKQIAQLQSQQQTLTEQNKQQINEVISKSANSYNSLQLSELRSEIIQFLTNKINNDITDTQASTETKLRQFLSQKVDKVQEKTEEIEKYFQNFTDKQNEFQQFANESFLMKSQFESIKVPLESIQNTQRKFDNALNNFKNQINKIEDKISLHQVQLDSIETEGSIKQGIKEICNECNQLLLSKQEWLNNKIVDIEKQYNDMEVQLQNGNVKVDSQIGEQEKENIKNYIKEQLDQQQKELNNKIESQKDELSQIVKKQTSDIKNSEFYDLQKQMEKINQKLQSVENMEKEIIELKNQVEVLEKRCVAAEAQNTLLKSQVQHFKENQEIDQANQEIQEHLEELKQSTAKSVKFDSTQLNLADKSTCSQELKQIAKSVKAGDLTHSDLEVLKSVVSQKQDEEKQENEQEENIVQNQDIKTQVNKTLLPPSLEQSKVQEKMNQSTVKSILKNSQIQLEEKHEQTQQLVQSLVFEQPEDVQLPTKSIYQSQTEQNKSTVKFQDTEPLQLSTVNPQVQQQEQQSKSSIMHSSISHSISHPQQQIIIQESDSLEDNMQDHYLQYQNNYITIGDNEMLKMYDCSMLETEKTAEINKLDYPDMNNSVTAVSSYKDEFVFAQDNGIVKIQNQLEPSEQKEFNPFGIPVINILVNNDLIYCCTKEGFLGFYENNEFQILNDETTNSELITSQIINNQIIYVFKNGLLMIYNINDKQITKQQQIQQQIDSASFQGQQLYILSDKQVYKYNIDDKLQQIIIPGLNLINKIYCNENQLFLLENFKIKIFNQQCEQISEITSQYKIVNVLSAGKEIFVQDSNRGLICYIL